MAAHAAWTSIGIDTCQRVVQAAIEQPSSVQTRPAKMFARGLDLVLDGLERLRAG